MRAPALLLLLAISAVTGRADNAAILMKLSTTSVDRAVADFNQSAKGDAFGRKQPPLTRAELLVALRNALVGIKNLRLAEHALLVLDRDIIPPGDRISAESNFRQGDGSEVKGWRIDFQMLGSNFNWKNLPADQIIVRQQLASETTGS